MQVIFARRTFKRSNACFFNLHSGPQIKEVEQKTRDAICVNPVISAMLSAGGPQARGNTLAKAGGDPASSLKNIKVVHYYYYYL